METRGRIVKKGMGGFLSPPGHPQHAFHVETDLRRRPENRGMMSLEHAANEATWLDEATRHQARAMLKQWEAERLPLSSLETKRWVREVLGYFKNGYRDRSKPAKEQWNVSNLVFDAHRDPVANADDYAGVHFIRRYYPDYRPSRRDFDKAEHGSSGGHGDLKLGISGRRTGGRRSRRSRR